MTDQGKPGWRKSPWLLPGLLAAAVLGGGAAWSLARRDATVTAEDLLPPARVTDAAQVLTAEQIKSLDHYLVGFEQRTRHQMVVVTVPTLKGRDINSYTRELANRWGIGRKGVNDGIVVLLAPNERQVRIEVGYGLEKILTNAYCKHVIDTMMLPHFKGGSYYDGLILGVTGLARVARRV